MGSWVFLAIAALSGSFVPQAKGKPASDPILEKRIDGAIKNGVTYLEKTPIVQPRSGELVLWTLLHAGVKESDPLFSSLLGTMLENKFDFTYQVSLKAMILEELDRVKYQRRIFQCAQFLIDNQCLNGQWNYGEPTPCPEPVGLPGKADVPTPARVGSEGKLERPKVRTWIRVKKQRAGPATGDNSNSQYAALGLRACLEAGIILPEEVLTLAAKWWRDSQLPDPDKGAYPARGWGYARIEAPDQNVPVAYGSMTAGALGSLAIYCKMLGQEAKRDPTIRDGSAWLANQWSATTNPPGTGRNALYYYLYAIERLGIFTGAETFGKHEWYVEGARAILDTQRADGSWQSGGGTKADDVLYDTCFAVLFLKRGTRSLDDVPSVDRYIKR
jgi:hypothetical protein